MIAIEETAAVLLCAGLSQRFGSANKLLHPLDGKPLVQHAADLLRSLPFARRIAVTGSGDLRDLLQGFDLVRNPRPEDGQDSSVRIGIAAALALRPAGVLICLGDIPFITADHLRALADAAEEGLASISSAGEWRSPPLLLPAMVAKRVLERSDVPVRSIVAEGTAEVVAPPGMLRDFDRTEDFFPHRSP